MNGIWSDWLAYHDPLLNGLWVSVRLTLLTLVIGLPLGLALAVAASSKRRAVRMCVVALVEIGRGTPALVMLQVVYNGIPVTLSGFVSAGIALALTTAAYTSEILRGGLQAVPIAEIEAGRALGMKPTHVMRDVILPQGVRIALPPLFGFCIVMFQATSLAFVIAVPELTAQAKSTANETFHYFNLFFLAGLLYAAIAISASVLVERAEKTLSKHT
jgi:polar amino acid transport system permease protein